MLKVARFRAVALSVAVGALAVAVAPATAAGACLRQQLRTGPSLALPDCRAYEQVSPTAKGGPDAVSTGGIIYPADIGPNGSTAVYMGPGPFAGAIGSGVPDAHLSSRTEAGWITTDATPPTPQATPAGGWVLGYDFSEDLSQVVLKVPQQALTPLPPGTERLYNLFLRAADGSYTLINDAAPTELPPIGCVETCLQLTDASTFAGASKDYSHILFETDDSLEGTGAPAGLFANLYERAGGQIQLVGVLPDGAVAPGGAVAGAGGPARGGVTYSGKAASAFRDVNHAISADGSRVFFEAAADGGQPDPAQEGKVELYERINGTQTVEVSAPAIGALPANTAPEPAQYRGASLDGAHVLFTSSAELTNTSNTGTANQGQDLYRYDSISGALTDLTADSNPLDTATGAGVQGVLGSSSDGSYVYFVATGQLLEGEGVDGQPNLYVWHENLATGNSSLKFIASLSESDTQDWTSKPSESQAYLTPDGRHLAFMSQASPTGYNNLDRETGEPDSEVYEYAADSQSLLCVSCARGGLAPAASAFIGATLKHSASTPFHQARVLSDDGARLFFTSLDDPTTGVAGPHDRVFEYERGGVGSCGESEGCIFPISSAAAPGDDIFLDASASGADVLIATLGQLGPEDLDNLVDVYDARENGGFAVATPEERCATACQVSQAIASAPIILSGSLGPSGDLQPPSSKAVKARSSRSKKLSCRSRALRIKHNANARRRALRRCRKATARRGASRGQSKR